MTVQDFMLQLKRQRPNLTRQQYLTIKGQAVSGNVEAAAAGLRRIRQSKTGKPTTRR